METGLSDESGLMAVRALNSPRFVVTRIVAGGGAMMVFKKAGMLGIEDETSTTKEIRSQKSLSQTRLRKGVPRANLLLYMCFEDHFFKIIIGTPQLLHSHADKTPTRSELFSSNLFIHSTHSLHLS